MTPAPAADVLYLDSSALVKLILREPESSSLRRFVRRHPIHASCRLALTEVLRAVRRVDVGSVARVHDAMSRLFLIDVSEGLLLSSGMLNPPALRTLDAIHLSAAQSLGGRLVAVVTYDRRMIEAADQLSLAIVAPS